MVESGGDITEQGRKQGYSKAYLVSGKLQKTKTFQELAAKILPDELLTKVNLGLLKHREWQARNAGLDKAYKARKIYTDGTTIINRFSGKSKEELIEIILGSVGGEGGSDSGVGEEGTE